MSWGKKGLSLFGKARYEQVSKKGKGSGTRGGKRHRSGKKSKYKKILTQKVISSKTEEKKEKSIKRAGEFARRVELKTRLRARRRNYGAY